jgi:hypothetical protein
MNDVLAAKTLLESLCDYEDANYRRESIVDLQARCDPTVPPYSPQAAMKKCQSWLGRHGSYEELKRALVVFRCRPDGRQRLAALWSYGPDPLGYRLRLDYGYTIELNADNIETLAMLAGLLLAELNGKPIKVPRFECKQQLMWPREPRERNLFLAAYMIVHRMRISEAAREVGLSDRYLRGLELIRTAQAVVRSAQDLRLFIAAERASSIEELARYVGLSQSSVRRRLHEMNEDLGSAIRPEALGFFRRIVALPEEARELIVAALLAG